MRLTAGCLPRKPAGNPIRCDPLKGIQLARDVEFFLRGEHDANRLFAIAQGRVIKAHGAAAVKTTLDTFVLVQGTDPHLVCAYFITHFILLFFGSCAIRCGASDICDMVSGLLAAIAMGEPVINFIRRGTIHPRA
jgi:hypothetical protein